MKIHFLLNIFFVFFYFLLNADLIKEKNLEAEGLYAVGRYGESLSKFEEIEGLPLSEGQIQKLHFNKGTVYLSQGNIEKAQEEFYAIHLENIDSFSLFRDLNINLGLSYLKKTESDDSEDRNYNLQRARFFLERAQEIHQSVEKLEEDSLVFYPSRKIRLAMNQILFNLEKKPIFPEKNIPPKNSIIVQPLIEAIKARNMGLHFPDQFENLKKQEKKVLEKGKEFYKNLLEIEKQQFLANPPICQDNPWSKIIPLFEEGYLSALKAEKSLENLNNPSSKLNYLLEKTVSKWRKAALLLEENISNTYSSKIEIKQSDKIQTLLKKTQEMELNDQKEEKKIPKKGTRW